MFFVIIGGILLLAALVSWVSARSQANRAAILRTSRADRVADIVDLQARIATDIGGGAFREAVEVRGTPVPLGEPLRAEFSGTPCLAYIATVTREWEETVTVSDGQGGKRTETRRGSDQVASNVRSLPFAIDDGSGRIEVQPEGAEVEYLQTVDRFEPGEAGGKSWTGAVVLGAGRRTLGYRYQERLLPLDRPLVVFGQATDSENRLRITRPEKKGLFLISTRSKEEIVRSAQGSARGLSIAALVMAILGAAGVTLGILSPSW